MATSYPGSLDNFTNPTSTSPINSPSHADQHSNANDAIEAIEGELGTNPKGAKATVKARLDDVDTAIALKAPIASPTFTGTVTIPAGSAITGVPYLATANTFTGGVQQITTASAATVGLIIKAATSQTVNLQEWQDSSGAVLAGINSTGSLSLAAGKQVVFGNYIGTKINLGYNGNYQIGVDDWTIALQAENSTNIGRVAIRPSGVAYGASYVNPIELYANGQIKQNLTVASNVGLTIKGAISQSANLQEWQNSSGTLLARVDAGGSLRVPIILSPLGGKATLNFDYDNAAIGIATNGAANKGLVVRGSASQSLNLQEWQNSAGTVLSYVTSSGSLRAPFLSDINGTGAFIQMNSAAAVLVNTRASTNVGLTVFGATSQTADLQQWQNVGGTVLAKVDASGNVYSVNNFQSLAGDIFLIDSTGTAFRSVRANAWSDAVSTRFFQIGTSGDNVAFTTQYGTPSNRLQFNSIYTTFTNGGYDITPIPTATLSVVNGLYAAGTIALIVKGYTSQTADLQQWRQADDTIGTKIGRYGEIIGNNLLANSIGPTISGVMWGVTAGLASYVPSVVRGATFQTANLQEWQNNSGTALSYIKPDGTLYIVGNSSTTWISGPAMSGTNKITANGNDLAFSPYFDGLFAPANSSGSWRPVNDATSDLGTSGQRWKDVYATSATFAINSSAKVALTIKQINSPTANMQEWHNYNGDIISSVKADGAIQAISGIFAGTITSYPGNGTYLAVRPWAAYHVPFMVKGFTAATADLTRWTSDAGTTLAAINSAGDLINSAVYTRYLRGGDEQYIDAAALRIKAYNTTAPTSVIKSIISQSSNLTEWQNYLGTQVAGVNPNGDLYTSGRLRVYSDFYAMINSESSSASVVGQIIRGANSQTADLQQWQSSAGTALSRIAPKGNIYIGATQTGLSGQINGTGAVTQNTSPLLVRGTASGQNLIELWAYGKDAFITGAVGNGTSVTYTTSIAHGFTTSDYVLINGISQSGGSGNLNIAGGNTVSAVTTYTFTVPNTSTQTYTSGGYVRNAEYPGNILQAYRSDGMSLFTIGASGGFAMADVMSVANVGYQQAGLSIQPNLTSSAAIRMYGRSAQTAEVLDVRNYINKSGGSDSIFAIVPDYSVSANADGYGAWVRMRNAATPATNPTSAGYLYVGSGALNYMGTSNAPQQIVGADGSVKFTSPAASITPLIIQHTASPTSSYFEIKNSAGNAVWGVNSVGEALTRTTTKYGANIQNDSNNNNTALSLSAPSTSGSGIALNVYSGSTTRDMVRFDNSGVVKLTITSDGSLKGGNLSTISVNTATTVDTVALSSFTTIEYTISIKQGSKIRSSKVLVHTDGTSIDSTEYGIMEMGGGITGILVTASVSSTNSILQVTITDADTTNATVKLIKTML